MRSFPKILAAIAALAFLVSCADEQPTAPLDGGDKSEHQTVINGFVVQYDGRSHDGETTTFAYHVFGTGEGPRMTQFKMRLPECVGEPIAFEPTNGTIFVEEATGETYIKWPTRIDSDDLEGVAYSLTYAGDVAEGMTLAGVKRDGNFEFAEVPGPGCVTETFAISGQVFVDLSADGVRDPLELGIAQVVVELVDADDNVSTQVTDAEGGYSFDASAGDYTLRIPVEGYPEAFNAELAASFDATTALEIMVSVGPDAEGNDFGFAPRTEEIIEDLEGGELVSTGEGRIFWKQHVRWAIRDVHNANVVHDREEMLAFLAEIQTLYLSEIFQFTPGNELQEAFEILQRVYPSDIDELKQQLLITELNEVSGRGLVNNPELQDTLIAWGEAVWVDNQETLRGLGGRDGSRGTGHGADHDVSLASPELIPPAIDIFTLINTGGGGGVDE